MNLFYDDPQLIDISKENLDIGADLLFYFIDLEEYLAFCPGKEYDEIMYHDYTNMLNELIFYIAKGL